MTGLGVFLERDRERFDLPQKQTRSTLITTPTEPATPTEPPECSSEPCVARAWIPTWPTKPPRQVASQAVESILAAIGVKTASQGARIKAEIKSQTAWIDILQRVIGCGIGSLIVRLAVPVSGLLYKALSDPVLFGGKGFASGR